MKIVTWLNNFLQSIFVKDFEPSVWRPIKKELFDVLKTNGEGLYLINIRTAPANFISKMIGLFSSNYSHTIIAAYYEHPSLIFSFAQWEKIIKSLQFFYGNTILDYLQVKAIVLSSANEEGIVCCDLSKYNNRKMTIRKLPFTLDDERKCIEFLCEQIGNPYDATGLVGWIFKKWDDPDNYYCSEICYDACIYANGFAIALNSDPSPGDIEIYAAMNNWNTIYTQ